MEQNYSQLLRIPKARVAILIGSNGKTKRMIEEKTETKLDINTEGEVIIKGDSYQAWITRQIVKAIGRGFSPEKAMYLFREDYSYEIIEILDFAKTENAMKRLKGRVIGTSGKTREMIEELTNSYISVYGKTISIIAKNEDMQIVRKAIEMLLTGAKYATVSRLLENEKKKMIKKELFGGED